MNDCIKLILILIVILVLFTFVTGANKGTEHFETRKCGKQYKTAPGLGACPIQCPTSVPGKISQIVCDENKQNCKPVVKTVWKCNKI